MYRRMNEIKRWMSKHSTWGKILHYNLPISKLKKINERLNCAFAIPGTALYFVPLITHGRERANVASKTRTVNKKEVDKTRILVLYIQNVQPHDRFFGWKKKEITSEVYYVLRRHSDIFCNDHDKEDEDLTMGVDFETEVFSQLRYQTFLVNKDGVVKSGGKIRIVICFENEKKRKEAKKVLKKLAKEDSERYPWQVYELKPKKHHIYFDTDICSMLSHWLTDMNLENVVCAIFQC